MENKIEFIRIIGEIVVFIMILLSVFLFTVKTKNKLANRLFGIYLLVIAFDLIGLFTNKTVDYPNIHILKVSSSLLQLPLFYLYVLAACYTNFKLKKTHLIHGLLFLLFAFIFKITAFSDQSVLFYEVIGELQFLTYIIAVFLVLKKYKTLYLENYSNANYAIYKWIFQITVFACIAHSFVLIRWYLSNSIYQQYILDINTLIGVCVLLITIFFVLKALYQPDLFTGVNMHLKPVNSIIEKNRTKTIIQKNTSENQYLKKLTSFMDIEKPYLDFELTLQKLASQLNISEKELSILINHHLGKHFFDFINEYRINEAKIILEDPDKEDITILEILYQVGFNSKSSFYTAFKKTENQTPTQYRKEALSLKSK
ncbi:helix-turn-helix transcriptional regulator [Maribacter polysiphoniae]|uniref:AraC-like DNA-binding protein n=1 Tax=Maribacter polysiphoniae TaxID=429344 RepID=A0A316DX92_9FLAO|nr:AraC family transcriptional regulator [Maribacter polysiphoniae]MBD1262579.1 helix-turn-helix transcriptional regulator [Maribacter polysiphoniae]PWK21223.1 AraC-like DNA-binding protein [Maribacter polysiphoniae]